MHLLTFKFNYLLANIEEKPEKNHVSRVRFYAAMLIRNIQAYTWWLTTKQLQLLEYMERIFVLVWFWLGIWKKFTVFLLVFFI
jgi:hypothetical protein